MTGFLTVLFFGCNSGNFIHVPMFSLIKVIESVSVWLLTAVSGL